MPSTLEIEAKNIQTTTKKKKKQDYSAIHDKFEASIGYRICIGFEDCRLFTFFFVRKIILLF